MISPDKSGSYDSILSDLGAQFIANVVRFSREGFVMEYAAEKLHGKNLRTGRVSLPNHAYLVTAVTVSRKAVFTSFSAARLAVRCFHDSDVVCHAQTLAFVVMPDHIHWLLQLKEDGNLSEAVRLYKAKVSLSLRQQIWQRGFHDHALRDDEDLSGIARYIIANPLRAGLVKSVSEYSHWDAIWLQERNGNL